MRISDWSSDVCSSDLLITHDLALVWQNTREMLVMYAGRVVERGPTRQVFHRTAHPYTRALLAASPGVLEAPLPPGRRFATIPGAVPEDRKSTRLNSSH